MTSAAGEDVCCLLIGVAVERNRCGFQPESFAGEALIPGVSSGSVAPAFIRVPKIPGVQPDIRVLLKTGDCIAAAENESVLERLPIRNAPAV